MISRATVQWGVPSRSAVVAWFLHAALVHLACASEPRRPGMDDARMAWIDNGVVRLGCDLDFGGAITWFSLTKGENVINNFDAGRQVQMSFYSGPVPYSEADQKPADHWKHLGWNPIQAGDDFGNGSRVLTHRFEDNGHRLYLKTVPLQWPLDHVEGECAFESWIELHGATALVRHRLTNNRSDPRQYPGRHQELPAIYANGPYHRVTTYNGDRPYTLAPVSRIPDLHDGEGPWNYWFATESWAALLNVADWGLGVWAPGRVRFAGGFAGIPGSGGTQDVACGYLAPIRTEILDARIVYDYHYDLILGSLSEIRAHVYRRADATLPQWTFAGSRQGWHLRRGRDAGWPVRGAIVVEGGATRLFSPLVFWRAEQASILELEARCDTGAAAPCRIFVRPWNSNQPKISGKILIQPGESVRTYRLNLGDLPGYEGGMIQIELQPPGQRFALESLRIRKE